MIILGCFVGSTILGNPQISDDRIFPLKRDPKGKAGFQSSRKIFKQTSEVGKNGTYSCFFVAKMFFWKIAGFQALPCMSMFGW